MPYDLTVDVKQPYVVDHYNTDVQDQVTGDKYPLRYMKLPNTDTHVFTHIKKHGTVGDFIQEIMEISKNLEYDHGIIRRKVELQNLPQDVDDVCYIEIHFKCKKGDLLKDSHGFPLSGVLRSEDLTPNNCNDGMDLCSVRYKTEEEFKTDWNHLQYLVNEKVIHSYKKEYVIYDDNTLLDSSSIEFSLILDHLHQTINKEYAWAIDAELVSDYFKEYELPPHFSKLSYHDKSVFVIENIIKKDYINDCYYSAGKITSECLFFEVTAKFKDYCKSEHSLREWFEIIFQTLTRGDENHCYNKEALMKYTLRFQNKNYCNKLILHKIYNRHRKLIKHAIKNLTRDPSSI